MARPVGNRIRQCLAILDAKGRAMTSREVWGQLDEVSIENASKYCLRSVELGLMTVNREGRHNTFVCVAGWREALERRARVVEPKKVLPLHKMINSVWSLGL